MTDKRLSNVEFLSQLASLFQITKEKGSVFLHQKRLTYGTDNSITSSTDAANTYSVLFRATDGNKDKKVRIKFSTEVTSNNLDKFWTNYTDTVKAGMGGLRKKDKKKKKASKSKKVKA